MTRCAAAQGSATGYVNVRQEWRGRRTRRRSARVMAGTGPENRRIGTAAKQNLLKGPVGRPVLGEGRAPECAHCRLRRSAALWCRPPSTSHTIPNRGWILSRSSGYGPVGREPCGSAQVGREECLCPDRMKTFGMPDAFPAHARYSASDGRCWLPGILQEKRKLVGTSCSGVPDCSARNAGHRGGLQVQSAPDPVTEVPAGHEPVVLVRPVRTGHVAAAVGCESYEAVDGLLKMYRLFAKPMNCWSTVVRLYSRPALKRCAPERKETLSATWTRESYPGSMGRKNGSPMPKAVGKVHADVREGTPAESIKLRRRRAARAPGTRGPPVPPRAMLSPAHCKPEFVEDDRVAKERSHTRHSPRANSRAQLPLDESPHESTSKVPFTCSDHV